MKVVKSLTINLGGYESLKIGVEQAPTYEDADRVIISELKRLDIPVSSKIRQCITWTEPIDELV
jgi:hypothetical protein